MMLTIHGLPLAAKYHEIRAIIKGECNLNDFILDNLVPDDDGFKKIRVGVADEIEGAHLMKCLNGFRVGGQTLRVVPVAKTTMDGGINPTFDQRGNYPTRNEYPNQVSNFNRQNPNAAQWAGNQWAPNQQMNQPTGFNYQQQIPNQSYMGQQPTQPQRVLQHEQFQNRMDMQSPMYSGGVQQPSGNKTLMPDPKPTRRPNTRTHVLRSVEIIEQTGNRPAVPGRYPGGQGYEQPKPITIKKDNFQGPNYPGNPQNTPRGHPTHGQAPAWQHPGIQQKPTPFSKDNIPYKSQYEDERKYPDREPSGKITEHHGRGFEKPRGFSPRRSPMNRGISPDRKISPGRIIPRGILDRPRGSDDRHGLDGRPHGGPDGMPHRGPDGRPRGGPNVRARGGPDDMPHRSPDGRPHRGLDGRPHGGPDGMPHRGLDGRPRGAPDDIPHRGPDGRPRGGPDDIPHRGADGRTRGGPDDISHRGLDGRPRGDLDSMPHRGPEGRPRGGPDGRPHIGHVDAPRSGPDDRLIDGLDRRPHGPDGRHYGRLEGRFHGGPDIRPHTELDDRPLTSLDGKPHGGPDDRRGSPGRRVLLPGRRNSPSHRGVSPSERRFSPSGRRISPGPRRMNERMSPTRRLESPERAARRPTDARHAIRYSPSRRHTDKSDGSRSSSKQVRPAYEPNVQAQNEAMYSGGYRPNPRENIQYPSNRQGDHISPWQDRENPKKIDEDRRDRIPMSRGPDRLPEHGSDLKRQPSPHKSRSPVRRERSPIRDRYRRHSPSPRSPRRSWALEKRRSPGEAPPPPVWPGQNVREEEPYPRPSRPGFHDKNEPSKPTWERSSFHQKNEEPHRDRRPDAFVDEPSRRRDLESREAIHRQSSPGRSFKQEDDRFPKRDQPKFVPIGDFRRQEVPERKHQERDDYREISQRGEPEAHHGDMRRQELPRRPEERIEDYRKRQEIFDKELDDVYKRAVEFAKKTDEMRRHDRRRAPDDRRDERQFRREDELRREPESRFDHRQEDRASRHEDRPTSHHSAEYRRTSREREWKTGVKKWSALDHESKAKRDKASAEISKSLIEKHLNLITSNEMKNYLLEELKSEMLKIIYELFGDKEEVSFIEMVVKCNSKIEGKEGTRLVKDVISRLPAQYRNLKRAAAELPETSAKNFKHTPESNLNESRRPMTTRPKQQQAPLENRKVVRRPPRAAKAQLKPAGLRQGPLPRKRGVQNVEKKIVGGQPSSAKPSPNTKPGPAKSAATKTSPITKPNSVKPGAVKSSLTTNPSLTKPDTANLSPTKPSPANQMKVSALKQATLAAKPTQPAVVENKEENAKPSPAKPSPAKPSPAKPSPAKPSLAKQIETPKQATQTPAASQKVNEKQQKSNSSVAELSPLMKSTLDNEIQHMTIKVSQEIPDEPTTDAEQMDVNQIKTDVVDEVGKVVGLNVSKRLLNVHNPLKVTIKFSAPPTRDDLGAFLRKYNFIKFKRAQSALNTFEGEVKTVQDFDALCTVSELFCGSSKLTVTANYEFTQCPPNLKTDYDDKMNNEDTLEPDMNEIKSSTENKIDVATPKVNKTADKSQVVENTSKTTKEESVNSVKIKEEKLPVTIKEENSPSKFIKSDKDESNNKEINITIKIEKSPTKAVTSDAKIQAVVKSEKATDLKTLVKKETNPVNIDSKNSDYAPTTKNAQSSDIQQNKEIKFKEEINNTSTNVVTKENPRTTSKQTEPKKSIPTTNSANKISNKTKKITTHTTPLDDDDYEEMDDEDILALISSGIVLDECSGSEED